MGESRNEHWLRVYHGDGEGVTIYVGRCYLAVVLRGFSGWSSSRWLPGGWAFYSPYIGVGRMAGRWPSRYWRGYWLFPASLVDLWRAVRRRGFLSVLRFRPDQELARWLTAPR